MKRDRSSRIKKDYRGASSTYAKAYACAEAYASAKASAARGQRRRTVDKEKSSPDKSDELLFEMIMLT